MSPCSRSAAGWPASPPLHPGGAGRLARVRHRQHLGPLVGRRPRLRRPLGYAAGAHPGPARHPRRCSRPRSPARTAGRWRHRRPLGHRSSWRRGQPARSQPGTSPCRSPGLRVSQQIVPLDVAIDRFHRIGVPRQTWRLDKVRLNPRKPVPVGRKVTARFVPGEYFTLSDQEQLGRPAFEERRSGAELSDTIVQPTTSRAADERYETAYDVDDGWFPPDPPRFPALRVRRRPVLVRGVRAPPDRGRARGPLAPGAASRQRRARWSGCDDPTHLRLRRAHRADRRDHQGHRPDGPPSSRRSSSARSSRPRTAVSRSTSWAGPSSRWSVPATWSASTTGPCSGALLRPGRWMRSTTTWRPSTSPTPGCRGCSTCRAWATGPG